MSQPNAKKAKPRTLTNIIQLRKKIVQLAEQEWSVWHQKKNPLKERQTSGEKEVLKYWGIQGQKRKHLVNRKVTKHLDAAGNEVKKKHSVVTKKVKAGSNWVGDIPWSAAFIVWVLRTAGVTQSEFPNAWKHAAYTYFAKQNSNSKQGVIQAFPISSTAPIPGDIVCTGRGKNKVKFATIKATGTTHCDIVTSVQNGTMTTIGGNVWNNVGKRHVTLTAGRLTEIANYKRDVKDGGQSSSIDNYHAILRFVPNQIKSTP